MSNELAVWDTDEVKGGPMIAEAISSVAVMALLNFLEPYSPHVPDYGEISEAITQASNEDPIFPNHKDGVRMTAAVLVAVAHYESGFHKTVVGDHGKSFGLFQIQPPTARTSANLLLNPRTASYVAIDLIRTSFKQCAKRPLLERLSWYVSSIGCPEHQKIVHKSVVRMHEAQRLLAKLKADEAHRDLMLARMLQQ